MTKCRAHPHEHGVGVCAACLRDRLLAVVAAGVGAQSPDLDWNSDHSPPPPPFDFPRSVSPYSSRRRHRHRRFFSTPQVGPTFDYDVTVRKKRYPILSLLFGPGTGSLSWFLGRRRPKEKQLPDRPVRFSASGRGMSSDAESACSSGYTTESSAGRRRPEPTPARRFPAASPGRGGIGVSGIAMCLSPLVRPNPKPAADTGFVGGVGDLRRRERRQASLGPSRSRKLADVGRFR